MKHCLFTLALLLMPCAHAQQTNLTITDLPDFPDYPPPKTVLDEADQGEIFFASASPFDLDVILTGEPTTPTTGLGYLTLPSDSQAGDSQAPAPAMIILPGSGGIQPGREHEYAEFLQGLGIAGFVIEYYEPRGLGKEVDYLVRTSSVTEFDLITDAYAALELLSTHPRIDGARIGVVGFSYGGMASRLAMDRRIHKALASGHPGFKLHIDVYGPCFQVLGTQASNGAPLLTLRGTEDASNDLQACAAREEELRAIGVEVTSIVYEGAGHAWENEAPRSFKEGAPYLQGCDWHYDAQGVPHVDGEALFDFRPETSRLERINARFTSGARLAQCVRFGYIIGRDEVVREKAFEDAAAFLRAHL